MAVKIISVDKGSYADIAGIKGGEKLLKINGHEILDVLDYRFYEASSFLKIETLDGDILKESAIKKREYDSIGLNFETYLMDKQHSCRNKCIFCFIDQMPKGMRDTLYFKDDDSRLSFLFGNYITLTNLDDREVQRIIDMHISPVNVSVHTTNPQLRCEMMGNRFAGKSLEALKRFTEGGINVNCQLVLCPGINDGEELERTLNDLYALGEKIVSIACVPVGLTRYREGLYPLKPYDKESAGKTLALIEEYGEKFLKERSSRVVFASDEFYLLSEREFPPYEFYEDFPQIENGVGLFVNMKDEFDFALEDGPELENVRKITVITGEGASNFINTLLKTLKDKYNNFEYKLITVKNNFFGGNVSVAGLLTGKDIIEQAKGKIFGDEILIPGVCLRNEEDVLLDDISLSDLEEALGKKITAVGNGGEDFLCAALGLDKNQSRREYTYPANFKI